MKKYRLIMHPNNGDTYLEQNEYSTVDEAVRAGMAYGTDDFLVVVIVDWAATPAERVKVKS